MASPQRIRTTPPAPQRHPLPRDYRPPNRTWSGRLGRHLHFLLPSLGVLLAFCWFLTFGTWQLLEAEAPPAYFADRFYDAQALSLLEGRLDVPPEAIDFEAFVHDGKYYGYFGLVPALLRVPLLAAFPALAGRLNRPIMLLACAVNLFVTYRLQRRVRYLAGLQQPPTVAERVLVALFVVLVGLGTTNLFLGSCAYVYHEAIMLGGTFGLLFLDSFLGYVFNRRWQQLLAACGWACCCFATRASVGVGPLAVLSVLAVFGPVLALHRGLGAAALDRMALKGLAQRGRYAGHPWLAGAAVAVAVGSYFGVNYAKFGTWSGMPLEQYAAFRHFGLMGYYDNIEGKAFHLSNFRAGLCNYFGPTKVRLDARFPWVYMTGEVTTFPETKIGLESQWASLPASSAALLLLSVLGLGVALLARAQARERCLRLPLLGALAGGVAILFMTNYIERYLHDWYPFLVLAGLTGFYKLVALASRLVRCLAWTFLIPLILVGVYAHGAFALVFQRENLVANGYHNNWTAAKAEEFQQWRRSIDGYLATGDAAPPEEGVDPEHNPE